MLQPLKITFRDMEPSDAVAFAIREQASKLDRFHGRIIGCRVTVESPHRHHHKGRMYRVRVEISIPGEDIVVSRDPEQDHAHENINVAIGDAFDTARRLLQSRLEKRRGYVKTHEPPPHARVIRIFPNEDCGFLATPDGREVYFHRNSVLHEEFDRLRIGSEVRFTEENGENGPQATTVEAA